MACNTIYQDGKPIGFACSRGRKERCEICGAPSEILCDYPVTRTGKNGTCDKKCCRKHSVRIGQNKDYCLPHHNFSKKQEAQQTEAQP